MTLDMLIQENCDFAREEGLAQGKAQAEAKAKEEKAQSVKALYENHVPIETIAKCTFTTEEEVRAILLKK